MRQNQPSYTVKKYIGNVPLSMPCACTCISYFELLEKKSEYSWLAVHVAQTLGNSKLTLTWNKIDFSGFIPHLYCNFALDNSNKPPIHLKWILHVISGVSRNPTSDNLNSSFNFPWSSSYQESTKTTLKQLILFGLSLRCLTHLCWIQHWRRFVLLMVFQMNCQMIWTYWEVQVY